MGNNPRYTTANNSFMAKSAANTTSTVTTTTHTSGTQNTINTSVGNNGTVSHEPRNYTKI